MIVYCVHFIEIKKRRVRKSLCCALGHTRKQNSCALSEALSQSVSFSLLLRVRNEVQSKTSKVAVVAVNSQKVLKV